MSREGSVQKLPTVQQLLDSILQGTWLLLPSILDPDNHFRDVSLIVDTALLQKAASLIDNKLIRRVVTIPGSIVFYEFLVRVEIDIECSGRGEEREFSTVFLSTASAIRMH